jgi:hypothetical protein
MVHARSIALAFLVLLPFDGVAQAQDSPGASTPGKASLARGIQPLDDFSPVFLGMYRKLMVIEDEIRQHSERYGVDFDLARAVCLYESGGNAGLTSHAGARGYFQVMPPTFRELRVNTNLEAGVKYLSQLIRQFGREDRAIAAYNGGLGRVGRNGGIPLETLQYVLGVGQYRTVLKQFDESIRHHATRLELATVRAGEDWASLSSRLQIPDWELRIHNAFLAERELRAGQLIAYSPEPRTNLFRMVDGAAEYRMRHGDNYLKLAYTMGIEPDAMRAANGLWHLQAVPAGVTLRIPLADDPSNFLRAALGVARNDDVQLAAARPSPRPAAVEPVVERAVQPSRPVRHRVRRGDTLYAIAARYDTTIRAIQQANRMGRRTSIRAGETLTVPAGIQESEE